MDERDRLPDVDILAVADNQHLGVVVGLHGGGQFAFVVKGEIDAGLVGGIGEPGVKLCQRLRVGQVGVKGHQRVVQAHDGIDELHLSVEVGLLGAFDVVRRGRKDRTTRIAMVARSSRSVKPRL